jgi:hypothetical protein
MVTCIHFFEMSEICRPKFIVRHSTYEIIWTKGRLTDMVQRNRQLVHPIIPFDFFLWRFAELQVYLTQPVYREM